MRKITFAAFLILVFPALCSARDFSGKESSGPIGSLKEHLSSRTYSVISLERRDYDSIHHAQFDGLVFFPGGTKYRYIRRLNDDHRLKLNVNQGKEAVLVKPGEGSKFEAMVAENRLYPHVLLGEDGREAFIVYCSQQLKVTWDKENNNEIYLEVRDPFKKENHEMLLNVPPLGVQK